jgi:integrase
MTPLRQRMIEDMAVRNMSPATQRAYVYSAFHRRSPAELGFEEVREYQLHLVSRGLKAATINVVDSLMTILAWAEVEAILKAAPDLMHRTAFHDLWVLAYASPSWLGLWSRTSTAFRMVIHVRQGKGRKDRYVMLSEQLLGVLRAYWKRERPPHWLFPGPD